MRQIQKTYFLFLILIACTIGCAKAQESKQEWVPIKMEKLKFEGSFYTPPTVSTTTEEDATRYCFENTVKEKAHPNKFYRIVVWEVTNPSDSIYSQRKHEELINQKLHGSKLKLVNKSHMQRDGISFDSYILENKAGEYIHFHVGHSRSRVYTLEVGCRKDTPFNTDLIQFIRAFDVNLHTKHAISIDSLSYTADFPYTPDIKRTEHPENGIQFYTMAYAESPKTEKEVIVLIEGKKEKLNIATNDSPIKSYKISETRYYKDYIPEETSQEQKSIVRRNVIRSIVNNLNGRLLKEENIEYENLQGTAFSVADNISNLYLCRIFYTNHTFYVLEVKIDRSAGSNQPNAIRFMESFHIK